MTMKVIATLFLLIFFGAKVRSVGDGWQKLAIEDMERVMHQKNNYNVAKNVIIFVGDGMGLTTTTASRVYGKGEDGTFSFEKFPNIGVLKTYSADKLVPDSASTATALFSGVKANYRTAGVNPSVKIKDCQASLNPTTHLETIMTWAQRAGKSTGFVTNTRVTHATPSALYAHTAYRKWECEADVPPACKDIARQLVEEEPGRSLNVIMGGGRQCLQSGVVNSIRDPVDKWACYSRDGRDLIKDWAGHKEELGVAYKIVANTEELLKNDEADYVLGVFANGHLMMEHARDKSSKGMPSLANMTTAAIKVLKRNAEGFVLMVEGGLIDFAHHRGHAKQALHETMAFDYAIEAAINQMQDQINETLLIVTADHSHSMVFSGYANRGTSITGIAQRSKMDNVSYTSLLYATGGPDNYKYKVVNGNKVARENPDTVDTEDFNYAQQAAVLADEVAHSGTDVLVYATGPMAHFFSSVHEQTYVAHVIAYAAKMGPYTPSSTTSLQSNLFIAMFTVTFVLSYYYM